MSFIAPQLFLVEQISHADRLDMQCDAQALSGLHPNHPQRNSCN